MALRVILPALMLVFGLMASEWTLGAYREQRLRQDHDNVLSHAALIRSRLESALNSTAFRAQGLVAYVLGVEQHSDEQIARALQALHDSDNRIRNVGLAPGNRLQYVYPVKGNEAAIGIQYERLPDQWPSVERAMRMHQSVLAGPVQLVQGGSALICRTPIYLADGRYWGIISTVIDLPRLLRDVGLSAEVDGVRYWLHGDNSTSKADTRILGEGEIPPKGVVHMTLEVPGGRWRLMAASSEAPASPALLPLRLGLYVATLLMAVIAYILIASRASARLMATRLSALNDELSQTNRELHRLSRHDALTGQLNRRAFDEAYALAWQDALRQPRALSVLMVDIDHFKAVNDQYGHAAGDAILVAIAAAIRGQLRRGSDIVARYGGEEFIVLTVGQEAADTAALAEHIRRAAAECRVPVAEAPGAGLAVTVSVGTCTAIPTPGDSQVLIERADRALYAAKKAGRNRVMSSESTAA